MKGKIKQFIGLILGVGTLYIFFLMYPNLLFGYKYKYRNFIVHSDKPIPKSINIVLNDAIERLENSELYETNIQFKLYLCNEDWRFKFFTRNGNAGGVVNFLISPNIFIRQSDAEKNQLVPPKTWKNSLINRPLSYFIAHEGIHCLQRKFDNFLFLKANVEIIEGYAEYIAKGKTNNLDILIKEFKNNLPTMNPENGLYDKYNLYVTYLIERKEYTFYKIVQEQPSLEKILSEIVIE
jgi:hypothetical protein